MQVKWTYSKNIYINFHISNVVIKFPNRIHHILILQSIEVLLVW